ncbi:reverse transcriptase domain-containing protein [Tanacetum coccineum]
MEEERKKCEKEAKISQMKKAEVPVKMPPRRNRPLTEAYEQEFEQRVIGKIEERGDGSSSDEQPDQPGQNQREDNRRWESGMKVNIPKFDGNTLNPEGFIDWLVTVEETKVGGGNTRPIPKGVGSSGLKCFNCGEPGHRQSECKKAGKRHLFIVSGFVGKEFFDNYPNFQEDENNVSFSGVVWGVEEESMPVYDNNIEDLIEEEEGFVGKGGFGGEEDNIEDVVVVANGLCSLMIQTTLNADFKEDINTKSHELMSFRKSIIIKSLPDYRYSFESTIVGTINPGIRVNQQD